MTIALPSTLRLIAQDLSRLGFRCVVVGGAVRDSLLNLPVKDFDFEVYGVTYERLAELLSAYGRVDLVGRSFGVVKFTAPGESTCDFAIPRRES